MTSSDILIGIVIGLIILFFYFLLLLFLDKIKLRRLRKKYDEEKDLSKQGERRRFSGQAASGLAEDSSRRIGVATPAFGDRRESSLGVRTDSDRPRKKKRDARRRRFG